MSFQVLYCLVLLSHRTLSETLELLEKQVQCAICLETYRDPKALACLCLHAYCQECIQRLLLQQQRDQEVECPQVQCAICLETYRDPKALACLHAYCQECIQRLLLKQQRDQEVECPQCRSIVAVAGNDPTSLPTVFFFNGLVDVYEVLKKADSNEIVCQSCSEAKATSLISATPAVCSSVPVVLMLTRR